MKLQLAYFTIGVLSLVLSIGLSPAFEYQDHHGHQHGEPKGSTAASKTTERRVDPYPLSDCPISGKKLNTVKVPAIKSYDGREVRFCCEKCPIEFEKSLAQNMARLDKRISEDQLPFYPLRVSVVTASALPEKPIEFVYGNRLVLLGTEAERADFLKDAPRFLAALDKAAIAQQEKNYPLKKCLISGETLGGEMGPPVDLVVAGRLLRLCCASCIKEVNKDLGRVLTAIDSATKARSKEPAHSDSTGKEHKKHD